MVQNDTNKVTYDGDGSNTRFEITFPVLLDGNGDAYGIAAALLDGDGLQTDLVDPANYTIDGIEVVMGVPPAGTETLTIYRENEMTQETDLVNNDPIETEALEAMFDKLTMMVQEITERTGRMVQQPITDTAAALVFPSVAERRNACLAFDDDGNIEVVTGAYPRNWNGNYSFALNETTQYGGVFYKSRQADNQGHTPVGGAADTYWKVVNLYGAAWNEKVPYGLNAVVANSGLLYKSIQVDGDGENMEHEPPAVGETSEWWEELELGGGGGLPNYIDDRAAQFTADTTEGFALADETTEPIDVDGCLKFTVPAGSNTDKGFYQDIEISETDENSKLQLNFFIKEHDADADLSELSVKVVDTDADPDVNLFDSSLDDSDYVTRNSVSGIYRFSAIFSTNGNSNLRVYVYQNAAVAAESEFMISGLSLGSPFYYTAPSTGEKAGTYKWWGGIGLPDGEHLYASGPEISQTEYPDLFAIIGDRWEAERVDAGWPASSAGYFYPGPSAGSFLRNAAKPVDMTSSEVVDNGSGWLEIDLGITSQEDSGIIRQGDRFVVHEVSGSMPTGLADGTVIYLRWSGTTTYLIYPTEADALANTNKVAYTDSGTNAVFQLIQVGGYLDDAFQGHEHSFYRHATATGPTGTGQQIVRTDTGTYQEVTDVIKNKTNYGTARYTNETRPDTAYLTLIVRAKNVQSVELLAKQTNREDVQDMYYSTQAPSSGLNRQGDLCFDGTIVHTWSAYPELNANKAELIASDIFDDSTVDPTGSTFVLKAVSPAMGWRTVWTGSATPVTNNWGIGHYAIRMFHGSSSYYTTFYIKVENLSHYAESPDNVYQNATDTVGVQYNGVTGKFEKNSYGSIYSSAKIVKIEKLEEVGYAYLRRQSFSAVVLGIVQDNKEWYEHEITDAVDVAYTLSQLDTKKQYVFNRRGTGAGALQLTGDITWPDGAESTDFQLEGNGLIKIFYAGSKWRVEVFDELVAVTGGQLKRFIDGRQENTFRQTISTNSVVGAGNLYRSSGGSVTGSWSYPLTYTLHKFSVELSSIDTGLYVVHDNNQGCDKDNYDLMVWQGGSYSTHDADFVVKLEGRWRA